MKTVFITGASGGIGKAIAEKFRNQGYNVIAPTRDEINLLVNESIDDYFKNKILDLDVDIIIHSAGINNPKFFEDIKFSDISETLQINTLSFFKIVQYLLPAMKKKQNGYILGISSIYGSFSRQKRCSYAVSKHGLNGMIKTLALELGQHNIKVNALSPGFVLTKLTTKNNPPEVIKTLENNIALGRLCMPEEIAELAYFLCSDANTYITGQDIVIDGGYSIGGFQK